MFGANVGSLSLQYKTLNENNTKEVWKKNGNQGLHWKHTQISVNWHNPFQVKNLLC